MLVTLRGNSAKSKEKSVFITPWSCKLSPWHSPLSSRPMAAAAANRSDTIVFMLEFLRRWQLSHGLLHMSVLGIDWAESRYGIWDQHAPCSPSEAVPNTSAAAGSREPHLHLQRRAEQTKRCALFSATLCIRVITSSSTTEQIAFYICEFSLW